MSNFTVREEDRPYIRPARSYTWIPVVVLLLAAAGGGAYYYLTATKPAEVLPAPTPVAKSEPAPAPQAEPAIRNPIQSEPPPEGLPTLENSDSMLRRSLADLMGGKAFGDLVVPDNLVRRIVATVDNLPRPTAPRRMLPLNSVPGAFTVSSNGGQLAIDAKNAARYEPYVRVMEAVNTQALVYSYARAYPLFQKAYEELGYPGKYFNDRLIQAIDNILATPEVEGAVGLAQAKVLYEFADPELETRSAGQKMLLRMGPQNAARVKAKLLEVRREILARR